MKNSGITLVDVKAEAFNTIAELKAGTMDLKTAQQIKDLLNVVNDTAKTQVAFLQALPKSIMEKMSVTEVKAIAGTLQDRDAELDQSLEEIKQSMNKPYK